jgi:glycosyltransferase involved in cell wall biosynthesis
MVVFGLSMIVKNEEKIITKCLESVAPYIGRYDICDTGSTDNTIQVIKDFFKDKNIPGQVHQHEWQGFSVNRTLAFQASEPNCDWIYVIDADDYLITPLVIPPECSNADSLCIQLEEGEFVTQYRQQLFKSGLQWGYEGIVHEYPYSRINKSPIVMQTAKIKVRASRGGDRSKDPLKYWKDAIAMEKDLKRVEKIPQSKLPHWEVNLVSRYHYYIAQSYFDFHDYESCIKWCNTRVELRGFKEEIYRCYLMRGRSLKALMKSQEIPAKTVIKAFEDAHNNDIFRSEAAYELCCLYESIGDLKRAWEWCQKVLTIKRPKDKLFIVEDYIYTFGRLEKASIISFKLGKYEQAYKYAINMYDECKNDAQRGYVKHVIEKITPHLVNIYKEYNHVSIQPTDTPNIVFNLTIKDNDNIESIQSTISSFITTCLDHMEIDQWFISSLSPEITKMFPFFKEGNESGKKMTINVTSGIVFYHKSTLIEMIKNEKEQRDQQKAISEEKDKIASKEKHMYALKQAGKTSIEMLGRMITEIIAMKNMAAKNEKDLIDMKILYLNNPDGLNNGLKKVTSVRDSPYVCFPTGQGVYSLDLQICV